MVGVVLTGHGKFAPGLASALEMVAGPQSSFSVVPFDESAAGEYASVLRDAIGELVQHNDGVLVYVDLLGGTPFNQAMLDAASIPHVEVVTGTNLPMLIESMLTRGSDTTLNEMVETSLKVGRAGIDHKTLENTSPEESFDEGGI
ncbi:MAG: PTS sugar transporter subunit IIA [Atopobiaceae bacterium]|jgi:PTS system N-acetylgalactosamine-specific IIA component|nr:PTS sugar transporter subunit IIA [Atopobiaceae bacterium]MCH4180195.1 PTS sugar transporter subunit IIA [Atopobiaceae bacterium]MCH4214365.1 PTS sugar transporter subunit IIA [Atopobiaceae bacterium]MCH4229204.1 PTS sugar transporter subunit IIA [Atopobiaceae bacterium]MCH4276575.1 PTS sugar transporter subunit IIA [Atopobiaceae bacterium]